MSIVLHGKVWKFGDDINTDYMAPSFATGLEWEQAKKSILHVHPAFTQGFQPGDVIVAGRNFGCGSSRQSAPTNLKMLGVGCVAAESFGRIFFRNSIAIAFPVLVCPGVAEAFHEGDRLELDFARATVRNLTRGKELRGAPLAPELVRIVADGGVVSLLKKEAAATRA